MNAGLGIGHKTMSVGCEMALRRSIIVTICVATLLVGGAVALAMTGGGPDAGMRFREVAIYEQVVLLPSVMTREWEDGAWLRLAKTKSDKVIAPRMDRLLLKGRLLQNNCGLTSWSWVAGHRLE